MLPAAGERLDLGLLKLDLDSVNRYLDAVGDTSPLYHELNATPPMALAAHVLGVLIRKLSLPPGTIHATQDVECKGLVHLGQEVACVATLSRPLQRGEWRFVSAHFTVLGEEGDALLEGKSTVMVPVQGETDG